MLDYKREILWSTGDQDVVCSEPERSVPLAVVFFASGMYKLKWWSMK